MKATKLPRSPILYIPEPRELLLERHEHLRALARLLTRRRKGAR